MTPEQLDQAIEDFERRIEEVRLEFEQRIAELRAQLGIARAHARNAIALTADRERKVAIDRPTSGLRRLVMAVSPLCIRYTMTKPVVIGLLAIFHP